jgi:Flp pilus assembly protein TadD
MDPSPTPRTSQASVTLAAAIIVLAVLVAFRTSFAGAFVFDDTASIRDNPSLRQLWPPGPALSPPPGGLTVSGRPILNLSLAVDYAISGLQTWSYHGINLLIHTGAALLLFGIARRTLAGWNGGAPGHAAHPRPDATGPADPNRPLLLASAIALLWAVHPLQTESVTYIVQRAESLMGFCYLASLYCFIRGAEASADDPVRGRPRRWFALAACAGFLGAGTKEVIVSAPVIVLLYDRIFLAGSFRAAWRRHGWAHGALFASWLVLGCLVAANRSRGGTVGLETGLPASWYYWATQGPAVVRYLRLAFWPVAQVVDYGFETRWVEHPMTGLPFDAAVLALLAATALAWRRRPELAFLGLAFFAVLAPTSIMPGVRQSLAEHRMYLALAPVVALAVLALDRAATALFASRRAARLALGCAVGGAALGLAARTAGRNAVYRSDLALWADVVRKHPENAAALNNLGRDLIDAGHVSDAAHILAEAVRLEPAYVRARVNLGQALDRLGRPGDARAQYEFALRLRPDQPDAHNGLGVDLMGEGRTAAAADEFQAAIRGRPDFADARSNLGAALLGLGRPAEAEAQFVEALRLRPGYVEALCNLGVARLRQHRAPEALAPLQEAVRLNPNFATARFHLGLAYEGTHHLTEAATEFQQLVRIDPGDAKGHNNLGSALAELGRVAEARTEFAEAVRLQPDYAEAHRNLGVALRQAGRRAEAIAQFRTALRLRPDDRIAREQLDDAQGP